MTLGQVIKKYREEHELSMADFARLSGMSKSYVAALERDKHPKTGKKILPSTETVKSAAEAMGMTVARLRTIIEPLDWTAEIHDVDPTKEDMELDLELWREERAAESVKNIPHQAELIRIAGCLDEKNRMRLLRYAKLLLEEQEEEA